MLVFRRSSLTVWTTNWEKIWSVWRRSALTAACGTSGGECLVPCTWSDDVLSFGCVIDSGLFSPPVCVCAVSTPRPPVAADVLWECPRRSKLSIKDSGVVHLCPALHLYWCSEYSISSPLRDTEKGLFIWGSHLWWFNWLEAIRFCEINTLCPWSSVKSLYL